MNQTDHRSKKRDENRAGENGDDDVVPRFENVFAKNPVCKQAAESSADNSRDSSQQKADHTAADGLRSAASKISA